VDPFGTMVWPKYLTLLQFHAKHMSFSVCVLFHAMLPFQWPKNRWQKQQDGVGWIQKDSLRWGGVWQVREMVSLSVHTCITPRCHLPSGVKLWLPDEAEMEVEWSSTLLRMGWKQGIGEGPWQTCGYLPFFDSCPCPPWGF
jgi:hypothetical protein